MNPTPPPRPGHTKLNIHKLHNYLATTSCMSRPASLFIYKILIHICNMAKSLSQQVCGIESPASRVVITWLRGRLLSLCAPVHRPPLINVDSHRCDRAVIGFGVSPALPICITCVFMLALGPSVRHHTRHNRRNRTREFIGARCAGDDVVLGGKNARLCCISCVRVCVLCDEDNDGVSTRPLYTKTLTIHRYHVFYTRSTFFGCERAICLCSLICIACVS